MGIYKVEKEKFCWKIIIKYISLNARKQFFSEKKIVFFSYKFKLLFFYEQFSFPERAVEILGCKVFRDTHAML